MKETRVEKYASYRKEIEEKHNKIDTETKTIDISSLNDTQTQSFSLDDVLKKHDEYTIMLDSVKMAERKAAEERKKRNEKKHFIINAVTYSVLGLIAVAIIILIIYLVGGEV